MTIRKIRGGEPLGRLIRLRRLLFVAVVPAFLLLAVINQLDLSHLLSPIHWAVVCATVGFAPVVLSVSRRQFDTFEPIYLMMAYLGFIFGLRGIYLLSIPFNRLLPFASERLIAAALSLATLGMLGIYTGYFCGPGDTFARHLPRLRFLNASERRYPRSVIALATNAGIGAIGFHSFLMSGVSIHDQSSTGGIFLLSPFFDLLPLAICLVFLNGEGRSFRLGRAVAMFGVYVVICLSFLLFAGKSSLLRPLFYLLVIFHYRRRKISPVVWPLLGLAFVAANLAAMCERDFHWNLAATQSYVFAHSHSWTALWELLFSRFYGLEALVVVLARVQHSGLLLGRNYMELLYWFVPRFLWAGKPLTWSYQWGYLFAEYTRWGEGDFVATTLFGDFYLNFGLWGLLVGSALIGVIARIAYVYLIELIGTKSAIVMYAVVLMLLELRLEGGLPEAVELSVTELAAVTVVLAASAVVWRRREIDEFAWLASAYPEAIFGHSTQLAAGGELGQP